MAPAPARLPRRDAVVVPEAIPPERLARYGVKPPKLRQYPGLKEEYYLADFEPDPSALEQFEHRPGADARRPAHAAGRLALPPALEPALPADARPPRPRTTTCTRSSCRAPTEQRDYVRGLALPSVIVPDRAVDAQSLIALADLVVSAGGTMNREAAALGVPVYTTYGGRLGGVDEELIREGRLSPLTDPRALDLRKREAGRARAPRPGGDARPAALAQSRRDPRSSRLH